MTETRSRRWTGLLLSGALAGCVGLVLWGASAYTDLVRREIAVADALARLAAASRDRLALVLNVDVAPSGADSPHLVRLAAAGRRAAATSVSAQRLDDRHLGAYARVQAELSAELADFCREGVQRWPAAARRAFIANVEDRERQLDQSVRGLARAMRAREESLQRFPGSLLAGILGLNTHER